MSKKLMYMSLVIVLILVFAIPLEAANKEKDLAKAEALWQEAEKLYPSEILTPETGKACKKAMKLYAKIVKKYPDTEFGANALWRFGDCYYSFGDYYMGELLGIFKEGSGVLAWESSPLGYAGYNFLRALFTYEQAVKRYPNDEYTAKVQFRTGEIYRFIGIQGDTIFVESRRAGYAVAFAEASFGDQKLVEAMGVESKEEAFNQALIGYQKLITNYPKSKYVPHAKLRQGECYEELGESDRALKIYEAIIENYPNSTATPAAHYYVGLSYGDSMRCFYDKEEKASYYYWKAIKEFQTIVAKYPNDELADSALNCIADLASYFDRQHIHLIERGKLSTPQALEKSTYEKLITNYPESEYIPKAHYNLGHLCWLQLKYLQALEEFHKVVENYPESEYAVEARSRIQELVPELSEKELKDYITRHP